LLHCFERDSSPSLDPVGFLLVVEPHICVSSHQRHDPAHAKLGRFLNDEIEPLSFGKRLSESEMQRRLDNISKRVRDFQLRAVVLNSAKAAPVLTPAAVEDESLVARRHPQHVHQVMRLVS